MFEIVHMEVCIQIEAKSLGVLFRVTFLPNDNPFVAADNLFLWKRKIENPYIIFGN